VSRTSDSAQAAIGRDDPRVFISYSSRDVDVARRVRQELEGLGASCWLAPDDIIGTQPWADQVVAAIDDAELMLVLISEQAIASSHVAREVGLASEMGKPTVPLRIDDAALAGAIRYLLHARERHDWPIQEHGRLAWRDALLVTLSEQLDQDRLDEVMAEGATADFGPLLEAQVEDANAEARSEVTRPGS